MKFINKTAFRLGVIRTYYKRGQNLTKTQLARKMGISRKTLYQLLKQYKLSSSLNSFKRSYSNNKVRAKTRKNITSEFGALIKKLNKNRNEIIYFPAFKIAYNFSKYSLEVSWKTYENILKSNNIYVPNCKRSTKKKIRKRVKLAKNKKQIINMDLVDDLDNLKAKRVYKGKRGHFGLFIEFSDSKRVRITDDKFHIHKAIDIFTRRVITIHPKKRKLARNIF